MTGIGWFTSALTVIELVFVTVTIIIAVLAPGFAFVFATLFTLITGRFVIGRCLNMSFASSRVCKTRGKDAKKAWRKERGGGREEKGAKGAKGKKGKKDTKKESLLLPTGSSYVI